MRRGKGKNLKTRPKNVPYEPLEPLEVPHPEPPGDPEPTYERLDVDPDMPTPLVDKCMFAELHSFCGGPLPCGKHKDSKCVECGDSANHVCFIDECMRPLCPTHVFCRTHGGRLK